MFILSYVSFKNSCIFDCLLVFLISLITSTFTFSGSGSFSVSGSGSFSVSGSDLLSDSSLVKSILFWLWLFMVYVVYVFL